MKNYKTIIAMAAAGVALVVTERPAEATLSYLTQGTGGAEPVLQVNWTVTQQQSDWLYSYAFTVGDLSGSSFTAETTANPVTSFTVDASFVNVGSLTSVDGALSGIGSGTVNWSYILEPNSAVYSDTVSFTSDYGPTLGTASANDGGVSWSTANAGSTLVPVPAPVPEASTVMAGALMLLPFGIGAVRSLRKERV